MTDKFKLPNGVEILSLARRQGQVNFSVQFGSDYSVKEPSAEVIAAMAARASLQVGAEGGVVAPAAFDQIQPKDSDYIFPLFRALSATLLEGVWLDFSAEGVLKAAVPLYLGQTVYTNHGRSKMFWGREFDVNDWVGAISNAFWDEKGEQSGGVSGVNVEMKIDWTMNVKLARGLLMKPPAIHSTSSTIVFAWDASHKELLEQRRFFDLLGEEVDGQIVRIIVTKVMAIYEQSLVFQGQDGIAKQLPSDDEVEEMMRHMGATAADHRQRIGQPSAVAGLNSKKETNIVKLTARQKEALGLTAHTAEDMEEALVLSAVESVTASLTARATAADTIVAASRAEVLRLATLAEGTGEGDARKLSEAVASLISGAEASQLPGLITLYQEKAAKAFPLKCEHGHPAATSRSSVESNEEAKGLSANDADEDTHLL
jgi:hypothetical protein